MIVLEPSSSIVTKPKLCFFFYSKGITANTTSSQQGDHTSSQVSLMIKINLKGKP